MKRASLEFSEVSRLFQVYSPIELAQVEKNNFAFANDVYNVTDSEGEEFVMRILNVQHPDTINLEAHMQTLLNAAGIRTPQYLQLRDGNFVGDENGHRFTLSRRIDGEAPTGVTTDLVLDFGATLARIHDCLKGVVVRPNKMQWFDPSVAQEDLDAYSGPLKPRLTELVNKSDQLLSLGLPEAVIHGDLWVNNTFAEGDKVTAVFDFETAQNTARIIDLARTYTSMRRETNLTRKQIIDLLERGYDSAATEPLTQVEKDNFKLAIAYVAGVVAAWHAAHGTRRQEPYMEIADEVSVS